MDLVEGAPPWLPVEAFVEAAIDAWVRPKPGKADCLARLRDVATLADRRWRRGEARRSNAWRAARQSCLEPQEWSPAELRELASLAVEALGESDARHWARRCIRQVPRPETPAGLEEWTARAGALQALVEPRFEEVVLDTVRDLLAACPGDRAAVARTAASAVPPLRVAAVLLGESPAVEAVVEAYALLGEMGGGGAADQEWSRLLEASLPSFSAGFAASEHADDVASIARALSFPLGRAALVSWGRRLAEQARPTRAEGLSWWLGEVAALRPALGDEVASLAAATVRSYGAVLRDARKHDLPLWQDVAEAWVGSGLDLGALDDILGSQAARKPVGEGGTRRR
jgi:hypothetical protein